MRIIKYSIIETRWRLPVLTTCHVRVKELVFLKILKKKKKNSWLKWVNLKNRIKCISPNRFWATACEKWKPYTFYICIFVTENLNNYVRHTVFYESFLPTTHSKNLHLAIIDFVHNWHKTHWYICLKSRRMNGNS